MIILEQGKDSRARGVSMVEVKMPLLAGEVKQGTVVGWLAERGDHVYRENDLVEVATLKINLIIPAPADGELVEIIAPEGASVSTGDVLGIIKED